MKKWTDEIDDFIRANVPCNDKKALLKLVNEKFNTTFTYNALVTNMTVKRIHAGIKPTQNNCGKFRGTEPKPIGTESIKKGFVRIKVAQPNVWKQKQTYIYELHHGVEVTKNECVLFLDGNNRNFNIENLQVIPRRIMSVLNNLREPTDTPDEVLAKIAIAKLKVARTDLAEQHGLCSQMGRSRYIKTDRDQYYQDLKADPVRWEKYRKGRAEYERKRFKDMQENNPEKWQEYLRKQRERRGKKGERM